jgi:hypothetical protein
MKNAKKFDYYRNICSIDSPARKIETPMTCWASSTPRNSAPVGVVMTWKFFQKQVLKIKE